MSYLLTQMFLYMLATFLLGLLLGWLLWRYGKPSAGDYSDLQARHDALVKEREDLNVNLDSCRSRSAQERDIIASLRAEKIDLQNRIDATAILNEPKPVLTMAAAPAPEFLSNEPIEVSRPEGLSAPRGGVADDLQEINGVGPALSKLLHSLGYYHFDQIAAWTESEEAWVDENLEGFKGRVSRDEWIAQAQKLANR
ncbi:MAG: hypothetical protein AB8B51_11505 [Sedimentitalea sp.]